MLIDFSVQNFSSFNKKQELNMLASTSTKESIDSNNVKELNKFGVKSILKTAAIFGANGSGKSNLITSLMHLKEIILYSLNHMDEPLTRNTIPFLFKENYFDIPSEFEISFLAEGGLYRYGLAILNGVIIEEWLFLTKEKRETSLFERKKQTITFNKSSFSEASMFVKSNNDSDFVEKTKEYVPFVSVLSQFDGDISNVVISWFRKLKIISGLEDFGFKNFTINLFDKDEKFKKWALEILKSVQINDLEIETEQNNHVMRNENFNHEISTLGNIEIKTLNAIKLDELNNKYSIPLSVESEGTRKLIYLLGPLYDVISNNYVLVVDEFDNRLHSLLCKFIIDLYNQNNVGDSQLIISCHDTNLLTKELFRRDQIWFIEKNNSHESELYSLLEYKEHYTRKDASYSKDYLAGKYGAIPLFASTSALEDILND